MDELVLMFGDREMVLEVGETDQLLFISTQTLIRVLIPVAYISGLRPSASHSKHRTDLMVSPRILAEASQEGV